MKPTALTLLSAFILCGTSISCSASHYSSYLDYQWNRIPSRILQSNNQQPSLTAKNLSVNTESPLIEGTQVVLTAEAENGNGDLEYMFCAIIDGEYQLIQNYSSSNRAVWTPHCQGHAHLIFKVRDSSHKTVFLSKDFLILDKAQSIRTKGLKFNKTLINNTKGESNAKASDDGSTAQAHLEVVPSTNSLVPTIIETSSTCTTKHKSGAASVSLFTPIAVDSNSNKKKLTHHTKHKKKNILTNLFFPSAMATESSAAKITCPIKATSSATTVSSIKLSHTSVNFPAGKTFYNKATSNPPSQNINWTTSNSLVATVSNGFIYGVNTGVATITAQDPTGNIKAVCNVTITESEPVKFAYSSPNNTPLGSSVTLIAITDTSRINAKFEIDVNGNTLSIPATSKVADGNTIVWSGTTRMNTSGTFKVRAYSYKDDSWSTTPVTDCDIYVSPSSNLSIPTTCLKRASDNVITFIGNYEGFLSKVKDDSLALNTHNIGHGKVVRPGETFYNNITRKEALAMLINCINNGPYSTRVNSFLNANSIKFNQQQFDALVSFSYNVGTGWTYNSTLKNILLNSYESSTKTSITSTLKGNVSVATKLNVRSAANASSSVIATLTNGSEVIILDKFKHNNSWYKIKTTGGITGYCSADYIKHCSAGIVSVDTCLNIRTSSHTSCPVVRKLSNNARVTLLELTANGWFKIKTSDGTVGYCKADYIKFITIIPSSSSTRNLNCVDKSQLINTVSNYHHSNGICYRGLLYRRYDELEMFLYADYIRDGQKNKYNMPKPSCMK